jgi:hypothetical protein
MPGKFVTSRKEILHQADQFHVIKDEKLRGYFISLANQIDDDARNEIISIYNDLELANAFRAWRNFNDIHGKGFTKNRSMQEIVRIPAGHVYEFLKAFFMPYYGENWLKNKKCLRHELIRPWWLVSKI